MSEYHELMAKAQALMAQAESVRQQEKAEAVAMALEIIKDYGLTADDLFSSGAAKKERKKIVSVVKYRDPESGATWTGRGKPPRWIADKDREQFLVNP